MKQNCECGEMADTGVSKTPAQKACRFKSGHSHQAAPMVELADTSDLKSDANGHGGSTPSRGTNNGMYIWLR